jgi:hypothetical protein
MYSLFLAFCFQPICSDRAICIASVAASGASFLPVVDINIHFGHG